MAASPGFLALRDSILELARLSHGDCVLDIGSGTGLLALAAAPHVARVVALDASPAMCSFLTGKFARLGVANAETALASATALPLADHSVDVVLSNYCFHHLSNAGKILALREIRRVLRPGGRLVFADMMFRLNPFDRRDRAVMTLMVKRMIQRGCAGLLRLSKNALRVAARRWEHPASAAWWRQTLVDAGFARVTVTELDHEGGIACAQAPSTQGICEREAGLSRIGHA